MNILRDKDTPLPLEEGLAEALTEMIEDKHAHEIAQHNASLAVQLVEQALGVRAQRVYELQVAEPEPEAGPRVDVNTIAVLKEDFGIGAKAGDLEQQAQIDRAVSALIGMDDAKKTCAAWLSGWLYVWLSVCLFGWLVGWKRFWCGASWARFVAPSHPRTFSLPPFPSEPGQGATAAPIRETRSAKTCFRFELVKKKVLYVEKTGDHAALKTCLNIVLTGNPGTGKTTFARMLHRFYFAYGVLPKDNFVARWNQPSHSNVEEVINQSPNRKHTHARTRTHPNLNGV